MSVIELTPNNTVLTRKEGAALLRVDLATFDRLWHGEKPALKSFVSGRIVRFRREDILALFDKEAP